MRIVSIGDLGLDYYYKNNKLLGVMGGVTHTNIIANLTKLGFKTSTYSVGGNDIQGQVALNSLKVLGVDTSNIKLIENTKTRCFHINYLNDEFTSKKRCPLCNNKYYYEESLINPIEIISNLEKEDILVFDNLNKKNQEIIDNTNNKKILDLGQYYELENLEDDILLKKIRRNFIIINFNERVVKYLLERFNLQDELELYRLLEIKFISITYGSRGCCFLYDNKIYKYLGEKLDKIVDTNGAGDAFISSIIKEYLDNNCSFDNVKFDEWYNNTKKLTKEVIETMGARGHIYLLESVKLVDNKCSCEKFILRKRKQIKRCNLNINNLRIRVSNALKSKVFTNLEEIRFSKDDKVLFIGTGGSYVGAYFSSKIINLVYGCSCLALYPRDVLYHNNKYISKIFLFSYSGSTNDSLESVKEIDSSLKYIITKGKISDVASKSGINKRNILSYRSSTNKGKERGFLAFEGALVPCAIMLKEYYKYIDSSINIDKFILDSLKYWQSKMGYLITKDYAYRLKGKGIVNIFRGDNSNSGAYDLESKLVESGVISCIIHEKKNFSHGRFINYENLNNSYSIYFKENNNSTYEDKLLNYLGDNTIVIKSKYTNLLAEFDLLVASQYVIYYLGKYWDIDVSKPKYSDKSMELYFYKGDIR